MQPPATNILRVADMDGQGIMNGRSTSEHDVGNAYKDDEKPWKKPGLLIDFDRSNEQ